MARLADIFIHCNDIDQMRHFYSELLKLNETFFSEKYKHLVYDVVDNPKTCIVIMESKTEIKYHQEWDNGPVFNEGTGYHTAFSIREDDFDSYRNTVTKLKQEGVHFQDKPVWMGYWTLMIKDPMGNTIDYYHEIEPQPEGKLEWG